MISLLFMLCCTRPGSGVEAAIEVKPSYGLATDAVAQMLSDALGSAEATLLDPASGWRVPDQALLPYERAAAIERSATPSRSRFAGAGFSGFTPFGRCPTKKP